MIIKFLGTGANGGVPQIDCQCINCHSARNNKIFRRLRSSLAISEKDNNWTILDCGPDFNQQISRQGWLIQDIKEISLTHLHADHSIGLAELGFGKNNQIKIVLPKILKQEVMLNNMFSYLFKADFAKFALSKTVKFVPIRHWPNHACFAIVFGTLSKILFAPDCAFIDEKLLSEMKKVDLIIFDGTFLERNKYNHLAIKESCQILKVANKPVIFTHINHSENITSIKKFIKQFNFRLAFDNMEVII